MRKQWSGRLNWLVLIAIGMVLGSAISERNAWRYHSQAAAEEVAEQYNKTAKQAILAHEQSVRALTARLRFREDMKKHPEKYRCNFTKTYHPSIQEQQAMADFGGARGQQTMAAAYNGSLWFHIGSEGSYGTGSPTASCSVSALGGSVTVALDAEYSGWWTGSAFAGWASAEPSDEIKAAIAAWLPDTPCDFYSAVWACTALAAASSDTAYVVNGAYGPPTSEVFHGPEDITVTWTIGLTGAYRRSKITSSYPSSQRLRHPCQQIGESRWFADADTEVVVTASVAGQSLSALGNYGVVGETDLTGGLLFGLTCAIAYNYAPEIDTDYGLITAYMGSGTDAPIDFSGWTFYQDTDSSVWHWHGVGDVAPSAANIDWYTHPSSNTIGLRRGAHGSGAAAISWSELGIGTAVKIIPTLYKANRDAYNTTGGVGVERYTSYDTSGGHPFELGLYRQEGQTGADVSVAPSWDGYTYVEFWSFGVPIPDQAWRKHVNLGNGVRIYLREEWMKANNEDVVYTLPLTTENVPRVEDGVTYPLVDIILPCVWHPLDGSDLLSVPWRDGCVDWARKELNLDKPDGTHRPSSWAASTGVTLDGEQITVAASGGSFYRNFKSRRPNRIRRMNAHLWTGSGYQQEVSHYWLFMTRHDLPIDTTGDDPRWWNPALTPWPGDDPGILYEDVTDWRALSAVQLTVSGATEDQIVTLRIRNYHLTGTDPNYLGAKYNFGPGDGEFEATWSDESILDVTGTLYASTGKVVFDFAPNNGGVAPDLEYVSQIEFIFPETSAEQTLEFVAFETVPAVGEGTGFHTNRISHLHKTDFFGGRMYVDGIWNYEPTYLYDTDIERGEVGFKHTRPQKHNPDYDGPPDDPTYLKSLAEYVNEVLWSETLWRPTWNQSAFDAVLKDSDGNVLGTPLFSDLDENGFALRVGTWKECWTPNISVCYCDCILQGSSRGVLKNNGVRANASDSVSLYYSDDNGLTKTHVQSIHVFDDGHYIVWAGREKMPRIFYLLIGETYYRLGYFYNQEEIWHGGRALSLADLFLYINKFGNFYRVYETSGTVKIKPSYGLKPVQDAVTVGSVAGNVVNVYGWNQGQKLVIGAQQDDGTEILWVSENEQNGPFVEVT